jgi:hypothetical protein
MDSFNIEATVFYKHQPDEVRALSAATIPLADHIRAVSNNFERHKAKQILAGEYFRVREAASMRVMFLRAANHARAHLDDYFPMMREQIIRDAEVLEEATAIYWRQFHRLQNELIPTK